MLDVGDFSHRKQQQQVGQDTAEGQRQQGQTQRPGETHRTTHRSPKKHTHNRREEKTELEWTRESREGEKEGREASEQLGSQETKTSDRVCCVCERV